MYSTIIEMKSSTTSDMLNRLRHIAENAFSNRAGNVKNTSDKPNRFVFTGGEKDYGCLEAVMFPLKQIDDFMQQVNSWRWIDEDPDECCVVLKVIATPVRQ